MPYIDPVLVLSATGMLIPTLLRMMRTSLRELLHRLAQPGRLLRVNVELHTDPDWDR